jgi:hypothetical protein
MNLHLQQRLSKTFFAAIVLVHLIVPRAFAAQTDPSIVGKCSLGPNLPFFPVHVHTLPTGKVMAWPCDAGISDNNPSQWDPASGGMTQLAVPCYDQFCSGHSFLADEHIVKVEYYEKGVGATGQVSW